MQFFDPFCTSGGEQFHIAAVEALHGRKLAYVNNGWMSMTKIGKHIESQLKSRYGVAEIVYYDVPRSKGPPAGLLDQIERECDLAIVGMAN